MDAYQARKVIDAFEKAEKIDPSYIVVGKNKSRCFK